MFSGALKGPDLRNHINISGVAYIRVAIHQPNHWPYLGFFHKFARADLFVLFDTAQFTDGDFHHRNRIRNPSPQGFSWLTVPVVKQFRPIREIRIKNNNLIKNVAWNEYYRTIIDRMYHSAPEYNRHQEFLDRLYNQEWTNLIDMNRSIIDYLLRVFCICTPVMMSSVLLCEHDRGMDRENNCTDPKLSDNTSRQGIRQQATRRIVSMCQEIGADTYLSGALGGKYMDLSLFEDAGIAVEFQNFLHPVYPQTLFPFVRNLSALDYILNIDMNDPLHRDFTKMTAAAFQNKEARH